MLTTLSGTVGGQVRQVLLYIIILYFILFLIKNNEMNGQCLGTVDKKGAYTVSGGEN